MRISVIIKVAWVKIRMFRSNKVWHKMTCKVHQEHHGWYLGRLEELEMNLVSHMKRYENLLLSFNFEQNSNEISSDFFKSNNSKSRTSFNIFQKISSNCRIKVSVIDTALPNQASFKFPAFSTFVAGNRRETLEGLKWLSD